MRGERGEVIGVVIHIVAIAGLARASVASTVVRDYSIVMTQKEQHLCIPVICAQGPSVTENYRLTAAPILIVDSRSVFGSYRRHGYSFYYSLLLLVTANRAKPNCREDCQHDKNDECAELRNLKRRLGLRGSQRLERWNFLK